jgi:putative transposase
MAEGLERRLGRGEFQFVTFSCAGRKPYLGTAKGRDLFEDALERMRISYGFYVAGYVVMPEHVHLLISEPVGVALGTVIGAIKLSVARRSVRKPFWLARFHDFNVFTETKRSEKLWYMHQNPVKRGLVGEDYLWRWSSCLHYKTGERGVVEIESETTAGKRERARMGIATLDK